MKQLDENFKNKFRSYFILNKISKASLYFFGMLVVIFLIMMFYIDNFPVYMLCWTRDYEEMRERWIMMNELFRLMRLTGIIGIIISMPITIVLGIKLKSLRSVYLREEYSDNKDFIPLQWTPNRTIKSPRTYYYPY